MDKNVGIVLMLVPVINVNCHSDRRCQYMITKHEQIMAKIDVETKPKRLALETHCSISSSFRLPSTNLGKHSFQNYEIHFYISKG